LEALRVRLAAVLKAPGVHLGEGGPRTAQVALAEEVLARGVSPEVLLEALKDPGLVWVSDFWMRLAGDPRTPPEVLAALLGHPWATLAWEAARALVGHPRATQEHLLAVARALTAPSPVITREVRDELLRALERRDETVLAIAGLS